MSYNVFGDLQDWGRVLDQIQQMRADGAFDDHQQVPARLARYPLNWQLRQAGVRAIAELKRPGDEAIRVAVQIMMDEKNDLETRILAGHAVSSVLRNGNGTISERARVFELYWHSRNRRCSTPSHAGGKNLYPEQQRRLQLHSKEAKQCRLPLRSCATTSAGCLALRWLSSASGY